MLRLSFAAASLLAVSAVVSLPARQAHAVDVDRPVAAAPRSASGSVVLPTGDRVDLAHGIVAGGQRRGFVQVGADGQQFVFPTSALGEIGRTLDPSLFDVTALAKVEHDGRIPVLTRSTTARSGGMKRWLGRAAQASFGRTLAAGRSPVARGEYLTLGGSAVDTGTRPQTANAVHEHTVTFRAITPAGRPVNSGVAYVYDVDDSARLGVYGYSAVPLQHGLGKVVVPSGHFEVVAFFDTEHNGVQNSVRELVQPQVKVVRARRITLDFGSANHLVHFTTPRPAHARVSGFSLLRSARRSNPFYVDTTITGEPLYLTTSRQRVTVGGLRDYTYAQLSSPSGEGLPYTYNLLGPESVGTLARAATTVSPAGLATVDLRVYSDIHSTGIQQETGIRPYEDPFPVLRATLPIRLPIHRTEYLTAAGVQWNGGIGKYTTKSDGLLSWHDPQYQEVHYYTPGASVRQDVNRYPLHPIGQTNSGNPANYYPVFPGAARSGDTEYMTVLPMGDNDPLDTPATAADPTYSFSVDGKIVDSGVGKLYFVDPVEQSLPSGPSTLGLTVTAHESGAKHILSTATSTTWTWQSARANSGTLPKGMACSPSTTSRNCRVDPMMNVDYDVVGERLDGTTAPGQQTIDLHFGHIQYAPQPAVTGATAAYSLDGTTWTDASVTDVDGVYRVAFPVVPQSSSGQFVDLRITGTDAAGGSITETITRALWVRS